MREIITGKTIEKSQNDNYIVKSLVPETLTIGEVIGPKEFIRYQKLVKAGYPEKEQCHITVRDYDELKDATCIRLNNGDGYVAVMKDGEIVSVLKNSTSNVKDLCTIAFANAVMIGGNRLDCYDCRNLPSAYARRGFIPICRIRYNRYIADPKIMEYFGNPDVIFYIYCGDPVYKYVDMIKDNLYPKWERYDYIPYINEIEEALGNSSDDRDYDFAHKFRDMIWGKWNGGLNRKFETRPFELMKYIMSDIDRLKKWMEDYKEEA